MISCDPMNSSPFCSLMSSFESIVPHFKSLRMAVHQLSCKYPQRIFANNFGLFSMEKVAVIVIFKLEFLGSSISKHDSALATVLSLPLI